MFQHYALSSYALTCALSSLKTGELIILVRQTKDNCADSLPGGGAGQGAVPGQGNGSRTDNGSRSGSWWLCRCC